jgi:two-component system, NtrC family, sensor kinase
MKLTVKIVMAFMLVFIIAMFVYAWTTLRREADLFSSDMRRDNMLTGQSVAAAIEQLGPTSDPAAVKAMLQRVSSFESPVRVQWVSLDALEHRPNGTNLSRAQRESLIGGRHVVYSDHARGSAGELLTYIPVTFDGQAGAVEVAESLADLQQYTQKTLVRIATTTITIVLAGGLVVALLGRRLVGQPVDRLLAGFRSVASGDLTHGSRMPQRDELGELANEFGTMCDRLEEARKRAADETSKRLETVEQLRHADRLRTVGQLTAGVAHELGTPLNVVLARASMIARGEAIGNEAKNCATVIEDQSQRMTRIIRKLLEFARPRPPQKSLIDLRQIARLTTEVLAATARKNGVTFNLESGTDPVRAEVDAGQLQQVLSNLVLNAIQAMPKGGQVTVGVQIEQVRPPADLGGSEGEFLCLFVQDQGSGIAEADLPRIFEPFFTTKDVGEGTGLGLSISRGIIHEHGGWISVTSRPGEGARFNVYLPGGSAECAAES